MRPCCAEGALLRGARRAALRRRARGRRAVAADNERVRRWRHEELSTYGLLKAPAAQDPDEFNLSARRCGAARTHGGRSSGAEAEHHFVGSLARPAPGQAATGEEAQGLEDPGSRRPPGRMLTRRSLRACARFAVKLPPSAASLPSLFSMTRRSANSPAFGLRRSKHCALFAAWVRGSFPISARDSSSESRRTSARSGRSSEVLRGLHDG